ncbi:SGNH/GDSL hydrolase family protein [Acinetobacter baumannii]|uniref:SGNH/GDSL hydrolase family protein n=1 Tax=Acinetobacter baumannii TaxID=470 RepID=UPI00387DC9A1
MLDGKVDLTKIDEIIADISSMQANVDNALANVNSALSEFDIESQEAIQQVIAAGLMEGFATEAELLASRPAVLKKYAKAEDTDVIWFWNKPEGSPDGSYWTSTGLSEYNRAINYVNANPMFKDVPVVAGDNVNNFNKRGTYTLSANLPVGQLANWPQDHNGFHMSGTIFVPTSLTIGGVTLCSKIFFPYTTAFPIKIQRSLNSTGALSEWEKISTEEALKLIFTTKTELASSINAAMNNLTGDNFFGKKFTDSELLGNAAYGNGYYVGYNSITGADGCSFNTVKCNLYNSLGGEAQYRVFMGGAVTNTANGYSVPAANQGNYSYAGLCQIPTQNTGVQEIDLGQVCTIPPNTPFVIVFRKTQLSTIAMGYHNGAPTGNLENRGFSFGTQSVDWGNNAITASTLGTFTQAGFQLLLKLESGSNPNPEPTVYTPELILPPKIYTLEGIESHIYPEHTLVEDYHLYEFDVNCSKGRQYKRGWVFTPDEDDIAGSYALSLGVYDKQKGTLLDTASTTIVLSPKNANSGITRKVQAIGDSLMASTIITSQILALANIDVMKVTLIGTLGTGANKFEGRGGWTINDYTTAGRTYYKFDVSGITTVPNINSTQYSFNGTKFQVQETNLASGVGTITCNIVSGSAPASGTSGTLTKANAGVGDDEIAFSNVQPVAGNPFWDSSISALNYPKYLADNSLETPEIVLIQLGVNDVFSFTSDLAVESFTASAFPKLDTLIASIKSANSGVKIGIAASPNFADQDAFAVNYSNGQTSWRARRNIVTYIKKLYEYYSNKEDQNVYVVPSGLNVDTENNYPTGNMQVNSQNTNVIKVQTNGVHPDASGYRQIGDAMWAFLKSI